MRLKPQGWLKPLSTERYGPVFFYILKLDQTVPPWQSHFEWKSPPGTAWTILSRTAPLRGNKALMLSTEMDTGGK